MIRLALVRHAKSDWGVVRQAHHPGPDHDEPVPDHDRPLADRGRRDGPRMAARLAGSGFRPDAILSSTAVRARTTAAFFGDEYGIAVELQERLYGAPASELLRAAAERGAAAVMVVAHDPGMSTLAERLSGGGIVHMPTCAVATFTWETDDWDVATALDPDAWTIDTPR